MSLFQYRYMAHEHGPYFSTVHELLNAHQAIFKPQCTVTCFAQLIVALVFHI
jgi:hypothetical protein